MTWQTCTCGESIVRYRGWIVSAVETLSKKTKMKYRCFVSDGERLIPVDPGMFLFEGRTIYTTHKCGGVSK